MSMKKELPKKISKQKEELAFSRPKKPRKDDTLATELVSSGKEQTHCKLSDADLASSPWNSLAMFCNDSYEEFIPWNEENQKTQESVVQVQQKCVTLLTKTPSGTWDEIVYQFEPRERKAARDFFFYISRKHRDTPVEMQRQLKVNLAQLWS